MRPTRKGWLVRALQISALLILFAACSTNAAPATPNLPAPTMTSPQSEVDVQNECESSALTQLDLNLCAVKRYESEEKELDRFINTLDLTPEEKPEFDLLESKWEQFAQAECNFWYGRFITFPDGAQFYEHGSMSPMLIADCLMTKTRERRRELEILKGSL